MDTSTDYMTALDMPMGIFLDCYSTLVFISEKRNEEMRNSLEKSIRGEK